MPCDHAGPTEVMEMAERWLAQREVDRKDWPGLRIQHGENTPGTMWASVVTEIERRGDQWWVTKIDRRTEALPATGLGLRIAG